MLSPGLEQHSYHDPNPCPRALIGQRWMEENEVNYSVNKHVTAHDCDRYSSWCIPPPSMKNTETLG